MFEGEDNQAHGSDLEAGKQRLSSNTKREATSDEVTELRKENIQLKHALADSVLKNRSPL
jgi:transposase